MKKSFLIFGTALFLLAGTLTLSSCGGEATKDKTEEVNKDVHKHDTAKEVYACPMHHDVTGVKGDKCTKCGMDLTSTKTDDAHKGHSH